MYRRGAERERELLSMFKEAGFAGIRAAKSTTPDLVVGRAGTVYALECKSTRLEKISLDRAEVTFMKNFRTRFGCQTFIAMKFNHTPWLVIEPERLETLTVSKTWALNNCRPVDDLLRQ